MRGLLLLNVIRLIPFRFLCYIHRKVLNICQFQEAL